MILKTTKNAPVKHAAAQPKIVIFSFSCLRSVVFCKFPKGFLTLFTKQRVGCVLKNPVDQEKTCKYFVGTKQSKMLRLQRLIKTWYVIKQKRQICRWFYSVFSEKKMKNEYSLQFYELCTRA